MKNHSYQTMDFASIKNILHHDKLEIFIKKITFLIRTVLFICILISTASLITTLVTGGQFDYGPDLFNYADGIAIILFFSGFYAFIWGTIPSLFLVIAIGLDNKYRTKPNLQPIKTEIRLLIVNIIIVLIIAVIMIVQYFGFNKHINI